MPEWRFPLSKDCFGDRDLPNSCHRFDHKDHPLDRDPMATASTAVDHNVPSNVHIVIIGNRGNEKSDLIFTIATKMFPENFSRVLPLTHLPSNIFRDRILITIIATSTSPEHQGKLAAECRLADAIVLTYVCDQWEMPDQLSTYWPPELCHMEVNVSVIVASCKMDLRDERQVSLEKAMALIMQQFWKINEVVDLLS